MRKSLLCMLVAAGAIAASTGTAAAATPPTLHIVALGDSYGSGTGAGDYEPGTEGQCWRSHNSYSEVVVEHLEAEGHQVDYDNVTCSGATTADLSRSFKGQPAQLDALDPTTDVVTLSIGTSDIDFAGYGEACISGDCTGAPTEKILKALPGMGRNVLGVLTEIHKRSPKAKIVLTGYGSQVSPGPNASGVQLDPICGPDVFTAQERLQGNAATSALDLTLRTTAFAASKTGVPVTFVSEYSNSITLNQTFAGHSLCQSGSPFYRGLDALAPGQEGSDAVLHLNKEGQAALASLVEHSVPELA